MKFSDCLTCGVVSFMNIREFYFGWMIKCASKSRSFECSFRTNISPKPKSVTFLFSMWFSASRPFIKICCTEDIKHFRLLNSPTQKPICWARQLVNSRENTCKHHTPVLGCDSIEYGLREQYFYYLTWRDFARCDQQREEYSCSAERRKSTINDSLLLVQWAFYRDDFKVTIKNISYVLWMETLLADRYLQKAPPTICSQVFKNNFFPLSYKHFWWSHKQCRLFAFGLSAKLKIRNIRITIESPSKVDYIDNVFISYQMWSDTSELFLAINVCLPTNDVVNWRHHLPSLAYCLERKH